MIVVVMVTKVKTTKVMFLVFCSDSNGKVNKRKLVYGKLVGIGSVMDNYAGCGSSCNSHNIG